MEAYRSELERRLREYFGAATVEISDYVTDSIDIDGEPDEDRVIEHIMNQMVNDWSSWLEE